jgi:hypothetical protein
MGSILSNRESFFSSQTIIPAMGPAQPLVLGVFPWGVKFIIHLHFVPRLSVSCAKHLLLWREHHHLKF